MFCKKKQNKNFFGTQIDPSCEYCLHFNESGTCKLGLDTKSAQPCAHFQYDPLKRDPIGPPPIKKMNPDDFKI